MPSTARLARHGWANRGTAMRGYARHGEAGGAWRGSARQSWSVQDAARLGLAWLAWRCGSQLVKAGGAGLISARRGQAQLGKARLARRGQAWPIAAEHGPARRVKAGGACRSKAWQSETLHVESQLVVSRLG